MYKAKADLLNSPRGIEEADHSPRKAAPSQDSQHLPGTLIMLSHAPGGSEVIWVCRGNWMGAGWVAGEIPGEPAGASHHVPCTLCCCATEVSLKEPTKPVSCLESLLKSRFSAVCEFG